MRYDRNQLIKPGTEKVLPMRRHHVGVDSGRPSWDLLGR